VWVSGGRANLHIHRIAYTKWGKGVELYSSYFKAWRIYFFKESFILALKEEILDYFKCKSMGHFCRFDCEKLRICLLSKVIPYLKRKQTVFFHIDNGFVWDEQTLHNYVPPCFTVVEMHLLLYFSPCNSCFIVIHHSTHNFPYSAKYFIQPLLIFWDRNGFLGNVFYFPDQ